MSSEEILPYIYPNIYPIHELMNDTNLGKIDNETGIPNIPNIIATRESEMTNDGLYLIDNGYLLIIYVKRNVNPFILKSLFEVEDLQYLSINVNEENVFGNLDDFKERIMNIIDYIRGGKSLFQNLIFAFEGTSAEKIVKESFIEDNNCGWYNMDYNTFYNRCMR
jgi:protein transport protein SEC24